MQHPQTSEPLEDTTSVSTGLANPGPSLQRATILFTASVTSFVGARLLLASI
jgi:hypothetical protein